SYHVSTTGKELKSRELVERTVAAIRQLDVAKRMSDVNPTMVSREEFKSIKEQLLPLLKAQKSRKNRGDRGERRSSSDESASYGSADASHGSADASHGSADTSHDKVGIELEFGFVFTEEAFQKLRLALEQRADKGEFKIEKTTSSNRA